MLFFFWEVTTDLFTDSFLHSFIHQIFTGTYLVQGQVWMLQRKHFHFEDRQIAGISKGESVNVLRGTCSNSILREYAWWVMEGGWETWRPGSTSRNGHHLSTALFPNFGQWCSNVTHLPIYIYIYPEFLFTSSFSLNCLISFYFAYLYFKINLYLY